MSGCSCGQAGSQFCESCGDYSCRDNPSYRSYSVSDDANYDVYKYFGVEHVKGVKAPDIPIVKDEQELKDETNETIRKIWDNF